MQCVDAIVLDMKHFCFGHGNRCGDDLAQPSSSIDEFEDKIVDILDELIMPLQDDNCDLSSLQVRLGHGLHHAHEGFWPAGDSVPPGQLEPQCYHHT